MSRLELPSALPPPSAPAPLPPPSTAPAQSPLPIQPHPLHPLPPLPSPGADPNFTWQYIWSFFARAPRVRAWLFQRDPPPRAHVVQSLLSSPMLIGYVFGANDKSTRNYAFPDIGDLQTVFCRDGDAFLGFHFGFQGINPIMPLLFQVLRAPLLANPNVIVRRTARQRAPFPYNNYYLTIEFNWFQSGALGVVTAVSPVDPDHLPPTGLCPFLLRSEHRIFNRRSADKLFAIADSLAQQVDFGFFPHPSHFVNLPADFLDPPDDYYLLTVTEPDDPVYRANVQTAYVPLSHKDQTFDVEKDIPMSTATDTPADSTTTTTTTTTTSNTSNTMSTNNSNNTTPKNKLLPNHDVISYHQGGAALHCDKGEVTSVVEEGTLELWRRYKERVAQSRRTGIFITMVAQKTGGRSGREEPVFGREAQYIFLSTAGVSVHGRIQRLCSQLKIQFGSPLPDRLLISGSQNEEEAGLMKQESELENEVDLTLGDRGVGTDWEHQMTRRRIENPAVLPARGNHGIESPVMAEATARVRRPGSTGYSASFSSDKPGFVSDERESVNSDGTRVRKRRRIADVSDATVSSPKHQDGLLLISAANRQQPGVNNAMGASSQMVPPGVRPEQAQMDNDSTQRRSFHLTHILSDSSLYLPMNGEGSSSARDSSVQGSTAGSAVRVKDELQREAPLAASEDGKKMPSGLGRKERTESLGERVVKTVWTCDRCGQQIRGKKGNLNRHIANKHENIRAFACEKPNCGRKFQTRLNLVRHETAVHLGRPYTCPDCPRAFKSEDDLKSHIKSAHDESELKLACEVCGSCFGRRSTLNRHMAKVHKTKAESVLEATEV